MSRRSISIPAVVVAGFLFCLFLPSYLVADDHCEDWVAKLVSIQGSVEIKRSGEGAWSEAAREETFCPGDVIRVNKESRAAVQLQNDAVLRIDRETTLTFSGVAAERTFLIDLIKGAAHFFSRGPKSLKVKTPFVNASVEGTEFSVKVNHTKTDVSLFQGRVRCANDLGEVLLAKGQAAVTRAGEAPSMYTMVRPLDAVSWALYYPPVVDIVPGEVDTLPDVDKKVVEAAKQLTVGQVKEAAAALDEALELDSSHSSATALKAIIAVVTNQKEKALTLAQQAVSLNPESAAAHLALSYAHQAGFDLESAMADLETAVSVAPYSALSWARLSELRLSMGDVDGALEAARQAAKINPQVARTQTVLGFAYLAKFRVKDAAEAFGKAAALDQAAPLPRLGLGLCDIRQGDLKKGRQRLEVAAGLDPGASIYRSYLGKAYFAEKNNTFSEKQLAMAKELDPKDPTPWLYDAVRKQSINRPVEALQDLQKSIELNDNRAVYRSRLLLDQDLAARSASLGRIYNELGFQQLALVEGWRSVNADPSNHSAHRSLADTYAALPRHENARVSEVLQAQLLQPININPVQPELAESGFGIFKGSNPANLSFNEFTPMFERNRLAFTASGIYGGKDTFGDEVIQSGVFGKFSYSAGQYHYETDGFKENNDQEIDIHNLFVQVQPWHHTNFMVEYRASDREYGDLSFNFLDMEDFHPHRFNEDNKSIRLGFHHSQSPLSHTIGTFVYQEADSDLTFVPGPGGVFYEDEGFLAEIQQQYRIGSANIIGGAGYLDSDNKNVTEYPFGPVSKSDTDITYQNFYLYAHINLPAPVTWTLGGSIDDLDGVIVRDETQVNPKFGVSWQVSKNTTLRAAAFRILNRTIISEQTIEPTQIAGFSQYFNDSEAVDAKRYGIALDHRFSSALFSGVEYSERKIDVPYTNMFSEQKVADWHEKFGRMYLFWTPEDRISTSLECTWERFERDLEMTGEGSINTLETRRLELAVNYFCKSGLSFKIKTSYIDQDGGFAVFNMTPPLFYSVENGSDTFFVADAMISYRLPKRYGIISIEAYNLFDESFHFLNTDSMNPDIYPEQLILVKMTLSL